jgi:sugar lactone lactonase YvrE
MELRSNGLTHRGVIGLIAGLACLLTLALAAPAADAAISYSAQGEFGSGTLGDFPRDIAVENDTGRVFVADSDNDRIVVFESGQPGAGVLTTFGGGELSAPYGIAIDQSNGDVYVSDSGNNRIVRYTSDDGDPPTYTPDAGYTSPASGSGAQEIGSFASRLALDSTSGDLLVADSGNLRVERFDSDGGFLDSFDGADSDAGAFTSLFDIAAAPDGSIYVIANTVTEIETFIEGSVVDKFEGDGTFVETLLPGELSSARAIGYDPRLDNVLVVRGGSLFEGPASLTAIHNGQQIGQYSARGSLGLPAGIAIPSTPNTALSVLTTREPFVEEGSGAVNAVKGVNLDVVASQPSGVTGSSAHMQGTVDPHGDEGAAHFEYRQVGSTDWSSTPDQVVSGTGEQQVAEDVNGLLANREYEVRLTATAAGFTVTTDPISFETSTILPTVATGDVTGATGSSATLNGSINPNGSLTTFFFEYGPTVAYGSRIPLVPAPLNAGFISAQLSRTVTGLAPGATFHYRLVAENQAGIAEGDDRTFVAGSLPGEGRAYEQVTPVVSRGTFISMTQGPLALSNPTAISFTGRPAGEGTASSPYLNRLLIVRGDDGWGPPIATDPPVGPNNLKSFNLWQTTLGVSRDSTHALVLTSNKLTPDAAEGLDAASLYRKDLRAGTYELVATSSVPGTLAAWSESNDGPKPFMEASDDLSTIIFKSGTPLLPGVTGSAIYRWSRSDGLEVDSRMPDGSIVSPVIQSEANNLAKRSVSTDQSRVLFGSEDGRLFMQVDDETVSVSVSELDGEEKPAMAQGIDSDGRFVFFSTTDIRMTADTPPPEGQDRYIYRYDLENEDLEYVDKLGGSFFSNPYLFVLAVSPDGQSLAYLASNPASIAVWHQGEIKKFAVAGPEVPIFAAQFSGNSKYLAFSESGNKFPSVEAKGDVYLYDIEAGQRACVSCVGGEPTKLSFLPQGDRTVNNRLPHAIDDSGRLFFTSAAKLLPADTNGVEDVYVYKAGQLSLITPGKGPYPAFLMDISADGRDVYLGTDEPLVAQDVNGERDIYDARIGGGFSSQSTPPVAPCSGEGCHGLAPTPPSAGLIGSESATDAAQKKRQHRHRCKKGRVRAKGKCVKRKGRKAGKSPTAHKQSSGPAR